MRISTESARAVLERTHPDSVVTAEDVADLVDICDSSAELRYFIRNQDSEDLEITEEAFDVLFPPGAGTKDYIRLGPHEVIVTLYKTADVVGVLKTFEDRNVRGPLCEYWYVDPANMCGHASCYKIVDKDK